MEQAEADLVEWRANVAKRDPLVRQARAAGLNINQIHTISGISRSTVYDILNATPPPAKRRGKTAAPKKKP